jgi:hypothetical protein
LFLGESVDAVLMWLCTWLSPFLVWHGMHVNCEVGPRTCEEMVSSFKNGAAAACVATRYSVIYYTNVKYLVYL